LTFIAGKVKVCSSIANAAKGVLHALQSAVQLSLSLILWAPGFGQDKYPPKNLRFEKQQTLRCKSNAVVTPGLVIVSGGKIVGIGASAKIPG